MSPTGIRDRSHAGDSEWIQILLAKAINLGERDGDEPPL